MASSNARYDNVDNVDNVSDTLSSSSEISEDEIDLSSCEDYCEEIGGWGKCVEPYKFQPLKSSYKIISTDMEQNAINHHDKTETNSDSIESKLLEFRSKPDAEKEVPSDNQCEASCNDSSVVSPSSVPDGGWGWVVVFASFIINLISDGIGFSFGVIYIELLSYFNESKGKTAWVGSVFYAMPLICGPIASALVIRYGCRKMTILGGILASIGFISSSFANSLEVLYVTFGMISGFGLALSYVAAIVIVAFYFDSKRGLATGVSVSGTGIGTFVFAPVVRLLIEKYTWRGAVLILGAVFLNITVCGMLMRELECTKKKNSKVSASTLSQSSSQCSGLINSTLYAPNCDRLSNSLFHLPTFTTCDRLPSEVLKSWKECSYSTEEAKIHSNIEKHMKKDSSNNSVFLELPKKGYSEILSVKPDGNSNLEVETNSSIRVKDNQPEIPNNYLLEQMSRMNASTGHLKHTKLHRCSVTYRGAMLKIPRYHLKASSCPNIYQSNDSPTFSRNKNLKFLKRTKKMLCKICDPSIFQSVPYIIFCCSNFLLYIWYDIPYVYMTDNALTLGIDESRASFLISIIGIFNTLGMVIFGYIGDKWWIDVKLLYSILIALSGFATFTIPLLEIYWSQCIAAGLFGFFISANYALASIIVVNIISLSQFTNAYGLLLLSQGIANLIGPPIGGFLFDATGNYKTSFFSAGVVIMISGLMIFFISDLCYKENKDKKISRTDPLETFVKEENGAILIKVMTDSNKPIV
ncbi:Monocarboxylate transporter 12 [Nymphon striatum]|nr:Monocarboxylate transporter 12 [Nymphon striatum]